MQLTPRQPQLRLQWRLTGLFMLAASLTAVLIQSILVTLIIGLLAFSPDTTQDIEKEFRDQEAEIGTCFAGTVPDRHRLTHLLDRALLPDDGDEIQFHYMTVTSGMPEVAITDLEGHILASSPHEMVFPPNKPLPDYLSPAESRFLQAVGKKRITARWIEGRVIGAGPIHYKGKIVGMAFARSGLVYSWPIAWKTFFNATLGSLFWTGIGSAIVGGIFGYVIARSITRRLQAISQTADAWSGGDLTVRAPEHPADELGLLSNRLNRMAGDVQQLISLRNTVAALEERQRITRDLHDTVKQEAFATAMMVGTAQNCLENGDAMGLRRALQEAFDLSRQMQTDLSGILMQLRAEGSPELVERVDAIVEAWRRRSPLVVRPHIAIGEAIIAPTMVEQVARILDEAIANAVKHSQATKIEVTLERNGQEFRLTVRDDGIGIPETNAPGGMGLVTMRERATFLPSGRLDITSVPGSGTAVTVSFLGDREKEKSG